ncbi:MAG: PKD domain-containing protein [Thermoplasmatales archaeon]|nr:PKD domain-containing protein [Thermoplasmatales archaeon]
MRKIIKNKFLSYVVTALLLIVSFPIIGTIYGKAGIIYVGNGGFTSIQQAINYAGNGDTIFVYSGIYYENIFINKNIKLLGENKDDVIIYGNGFGDVIHIEDCSVEIKNFTIINSGVNEGDAGIEIKSANNCYIGEVEIKNSYYGVYIISSGNVFIQKSSITNNYYGIYSMFSYNITISENEIFYNYRDGIYAQVVENGQIILNKISGNLKNGLYLRASNSINIKGNNISSSENGIWLILSDENSLENNVIAGNDIGLKIDGSSNNTIFLNNFFSNSIFNARDDSSNFYDNGSAGNYWSDYTGSDGNGDGIGDTPYAIPPGNNRDYHPLMNPTITDTIPPRIESINIHPVVQELNGYTNITSIVTDNLGVGDVKINITFPDSTSLVADMNQIFGSVYFYVVNCPIYGNYSFFIIANDLFNNTNSSLLYNFSVSLPQELPKISNVNALPSIQEYPKTVNISCYVNDNVGVGDVKTIIKRDDFLVGNYTMEKISTDENGNGLYCYYFTPPYISNYSYYIWVEDINSNKNNSSYYTFSVVDTTPPQIKNISISPEIKFVGGYVNISCEIYDNYAVNNSFVELHFPTGVVSNISMSKINNTFFINQSLVINGTYEFKILTSDFCNNFNNSSIYEFFVTFPPIANFTYEPLNPTDLDIITFNASSSYDLDGSIVNYTWQFGDGSIAYGEIAEHIYSNDGNYIVKLTVYDNDGAYSSIEKNITVSNIIPFANFTFQPENPIVGEEVSFYDLSSDADGSIKIWEWDFGDGTNLSGGKEEHKNPKHVYRRNGIFNITLTVYDDDYAKNTTSKQIEVIDIYPPSIENLSVHPNPQEIGNEVNISCDIFDDVEVSEARIIITMPNGSQINESMLLAEKYYYKIQCNQEGNHTFFIFAKDTSNNSNISQALNFTIIVPPEPPRIENVRLQSVQQYGLPLNISCYVYDNIAVKETRIVFSDGNFSMSGIVDEKGNGIYYYNSTFDMGLHAFYIYAEDINGFFNISTNYSFEIIDTLLPEIKNLIFEEICQPEEVNISCNVFDNRGIKEVKINISGIEKIMNGYGNLFYINENLSSGNYSFYIIAEDLSNNKNSTSYYSFIVTYFPVANDDHAITDEDTSIYIDITSNDYDIDGSINESSVTITQNPFHGSVNVYSNGTIKYTPDEDYYGIDSFKYKVKDNSNAWSNEAWVNITINSINDVPVADFEWEPLNPKINDTVYFFDLSYDLDGFIVNYTWEFGDGNISYEKNSTHRYNSGGNYIVVLTIKDNEGKNSTISKEIYISEEILIANFTILNENPCSKEEISFFDLSYGATSWLWDFGDGSISYEKNPKHVYQIGSYYNVTLTIFNGSRNASISKIIQVGTKIEIVKNEKNVVNYLPWFGNEKKASEIAEIIGGEIMPNGSVISKWNVSKGAFDSYIVGISPPSYDFMVYPYDVIVLRVAESGYFIEDAFPVTSRIVNVTKNENNVVNHFSWSAFYSVNASQIAEIIGSEIMPDGSVISKWNVSKGAFDSYIVGISPPSYDFMVYPGDTIVLRVAISGEFLIEVIK